MTARQQVRRATIEDLPQLKGLWQQERLVGGDLERRFKEFQVVAEADGRVLGALGLQVAGAEGRLHSEVFLQFDQADALRELLWQRIKIMGANFGLVRVWTQLDSLFWRQNVFETASAERLEKLPASFGGGARPWLVVQIKEEVSAAAVALEQELALLKAAERERIDGLIRRGRFLKGIATGILLLVFLLVVVWAFSLVKLKSRVPGR
jgi:N-acetylglutamate synthase-like GNAT family acetyltransferase